MKKIYFWLSLFINLSLVIVLVFSLINNKNSNNFWTWINDKFNSWNLSKSWILIKNEIKNFSKEELEKECKKIIDWKKSNFIEKTELYSLYKDINLDNLKNNNEYLALLNLKKLNCEFFNWNDYYKTCNILKTNDIKNIDNNIIKDAYGRTLLKSMILGFNKCDELSSQKEKKECNIYFNNYIDLEKLYTWSIIWSSSVEVWRIFNDLWEKIFLEKLNKEFIEKCNKLDFSKE